MKEAGINLAQGSIGCSLRYQPTWHASGIVPVNRILAGPGFGCLVKASNVRYMINRFLAIDFESQKRSPGI